MELELQKTEDGSHTLFWKEKNEHYHSVHGSINEAMVVYINATLLPLLEMAKIYGIEVLRIFEMGFGTGLNTLLSLAWVEKWIAAQGLGLKVEYTSIEYYPLDKELWRELNHAEHVQRMFPVSGLDLGSCFMAIQEQGFSEIRPGKDNCLLETDVQDITRHFSLRKLKGDITTVELPLNYFHGVYYDAFAPSIQPELWVPSIFEKLYRSQVAEGVYGGDGDEVSLDRIPSSSRYMGILSTYCAQGKFKRALREAGYRVENLPGPAGKREITRGFVQ